MLASNTGTSDLPDSMLAAVSNTLPDSVLLEVASDRVDRAVCRKPADFTDDDRVVLPDAEGDSQFLSMLSVMELAARFNVDDICLAAAAPFFHTSDTLTLASGEPWIMLASSQ